MSWLTVKKYNKLKKILKNDSIFYQEYNSTGQKILQIDSINMNGHIKDYINKHYNCTSICAAILIKF